MAKIDPEAERQRLVEFYSHQLDGDLERVAAQADELTDVARDALRAEMARRGLTGQAAAHDAAGAVAASPSSSLSPGDLSSGDLPPDSIPVEPGDPDAMVTIRKFRDLPEALFAKGSLESSGIECCLLDDNMVRLDWFISNLLGGVKLQVRREEATIANEMLNQPIPENFDVSGVGPYEQPRCPKCGSLDVNYQEVSPAAYLSTVVSVPIPFQRAAWRCHSCSVEWEDDGAPPSAAT